MYFNNQTPHFPSVWYSFRHAFPRTIAISGFNYLFLTYCLCTVQLADWFALKIWSCYHLLFLSNDQNKSSRWRSYFQGERSNDQNNLTVFKLYAWLICPENIKQLSHIVFLYWPGQDLDVEGHQDFQDNCHNVRVKAPNVIITLIISE